MYRWPDSTHLPYPKGIICAKLVWAQQWSSSAHLRHFKQQGEFEPLYYTTQRLNYDWEINPSQVVIKNVALEGGRAGWSYLLEIWILKTSIHSWNFQNYYRMISRSNFHTYRTKITVGSSAIETITIKAVSSLLKYHLLKLKKRAVLFLWNWVVLEIVGWAPDFKGKKK